VTAVPFTLLPAVDVADGRAVQVVQGATSTDGRGEVGHDTSDTAPTDATPTVTTPTEVALRWQASGAEWIHLVDLDAAFGTGSNGDLLATVIGELDVNVELSGGIRDDASLDRALSSGCSRIILATTALLDMDWCERTIASHGERIAVGLDVRIVVSPDGSMTHRLAARGATADGVEGDLWETIAHLDRAGCARYVVTDVSKDGMLQGPNIDLYEAVSSMSDAAVIASGGVSSIEDLVVLAERGAAGATLEGSIVGKALYAGRFTLPAALDAIRRVAMPPRR
jgi:phosphoribosyl isomerase A